MRWRKLGHVYTAAGEAAWARSHAFLPTVLPLDDERLRVYVAFLDKERIGRIGYVDVDASNPLRVLNVSQEPVLDIGIPGTFDDNGVNPIAVIREGDRIYLFYNGWQIPTRIRYTFFLGLAISTDGGETFTRHSQVPVLDRADGELYFRTAACILRDEGKWRMWYIGGDQWVDVHGKLRPHYNMRYLESDRLDTWGAPGRVLIDVYGDDEHGLGRPVVIRDGNLYRMWYGVRTKSRGYHAGYAESPDGLVWRRRDELAGIEVSESGWDCEMLCCLAIQPTRYGTYMFYNGNNYGETGFGVAILE
ncbi:MAG: glucosyl hydrolase [Acidobacteriota bacterium]|nr:glucosyl hydrolase [Acidobacteriota bacterium]